MDFSDFFPTFADSFIIMKTAKFYFDFCLEADTENVLPHYIFTADMPDEDYEELYEVWYANDCHLDNFTSNWDGHQSLFEKLDVTMHARVDALPADAKDWADGFYWRVSDETEKEF